MGTLPAALCLVELCTVAVALGLFRDGVRMPSGEHPLEPLDVEPDDFALDPAFPSVRPSGLYGQRSLAMEMFDPAKETYTFDPAFSSAPPSGMHGKNLLLVGDSNDRKLLKFMCAQYGAEVKSVGQMACGDRTLEIPAYIKDGALHDPSRTFVCHIPKYNLSIMNLFHFGALSMAPEPKWHFDALRMVWLFADHLPRASGTGSRNISAADLVCFWRSAIARELPQRPSVVVAQSSLWDSVVAWGYLVWKGRRPVLPQDGLERIGWQRPGPSAGADPWGWPEHASTLMESLRGLGAQKLYWRTNPNCPTDGLGRLMIDRASGFMADSVRAAVAAGEGIWSEVGLIDWRSHYWSRSEDCDWVHYSTFGFANLIDLIDQAFQKAV